MTLPFVFIEYFQASEDYYNNFFYASITRLIRVLGYIITLSVPAVYIALTAYHQEMIPTPLLLSISAARQGVPFPTIVEEIGLLFVFEILRETGVRMPTAIGQTISIIGALVLGQAAVEAKLVSAPIIIVVALTGITGLIIPRLKGANILIRLVLLLLSAFLGLYGFVFGIIVLLIHLFGMRSFGIPYMLNFNSLKPQDLKDTVIRAPWWYMHYRPKFIAANNYINKVKGGLLIQKERTETSHANVALEVFSELTNTKIKPIYSDGKLTMKLDVYVTAAIGEIGGIENYINEPGRTKLKKDAEESLKDNIKRVIKKVQNDYGSDIFGFGSIVKGDMPYVWKDIEKDWEKIYKALDVNVNVDINITNSALVVKPVKKGD